MKKRPILLAGFALAIFFFGFAKKTPGGKPAKDILQANLNTAIQPGADFFEYANGGWIKKNPIPASESAWGVGNLVQNEIYNNIKKINVDAAKANAAKGTETQKIGDFWATAMDSAGCDKNGLTPIKQQLDHINTLSDSKAIITEAFALRPYGVGTFFSFYVGQDEKNSSVMAVHASQGGLGLPDKDFYTNTDTASETIRKKYEKHIGAMLRLTGSDDASAEKAGKGVMKFETALATASRELEDLRIPEKNYNKMAVADFTSKYTPSIDWNTQMKQYSLNRVDSIIVGQPEFFTALDGLLKTTSVEDLRAYLKFNLISGYADFLSKTIDQENFKFYGTVLQGQMQQRARWKRVLDAEEQAMGMVLGKLFVKEYFNEKAKKRYDNMVEAIRNAYRERIKKLPWMGDETKQKALHKLETMTKKVGYPDKWKDYSLLIIGRNSYCENMMNASRWLFNDMISKYGKPVDRTEWDMTPQTYNAYYNPSNNEIVLPAAIFTIPGIPDSLADDAMVYGYGAASTIGHEITHGFDDEGRLYDANGNLSNWWTSSDSAEFVKRSQGLVDQFNLYEPLPGEHINGRATLGENLADLGGIVLGLDAFKLTDQYKQGKKIGGLTPLQRYFLGYALGWLGQQRKERLHQRLLSDVHSPAKWRVNGPFVNVNEFYDAFGIKAGDAMYVAPDKRVSVW